MANYTKHYQLHQWEPEDPFLRTDFNEDLEKIDSALGGLGNCRIATGSYVGTGERGPDHPNQLTFDFTPQAICLDTHTVDDYNTIPQYYIMFHGASHAFAKDTQSKNVLSWTDTGVSWYHSSLNDSKGATRQFNTSGVTYHYLAIG